MKKRMRTSLTALLTASLLMGGCAFDDQIPDLSDEEMKMVEEYAAHLLLKYDENYKAAVLSDEAMQAERERLMRLAAVQAQIRKEQEERAAQKAEEKRTVPKVLLKVKAERKRAVRYLPILTISLALKGLK